MEAHRKITAPRVHVGRPADLGHGPRLPASFVQLESHDLTALVVPPYMEHL
jgi:hypothetical protein